MNAYHTIANAIQTGAFHAGGGLLSMRNTRPIRSRLKERGNDSHLDDQLTVTFFDDKVQPGCSKDLGDILPA